MTKTERRRNIKLKAIKYKGSKCARCGKEFHPVIMDFHHINQSEKDFNINTLRDYSWKRVKEELDKCILICANCHRLIHYGDY